MRMESLSLLILVWQRRLEAQTEFTRIKLSQGMTEITLLLLLLIVVVVLV